MYNLMFYLFILTDSVAEKSEAKAEWCSVHASWWQFGVTCASVLVAVIWLIIYFVSEILRWKPRFEWNGSNGNIYIENLSGKNAKGSLDLKLPIYVICNRDDLNCVKSGDFSNCLFKRTLKWEMYDCIHYDTNHTGEKAFKDFFYRIMNKTVFIHSNAEHSDNIIIPSNDLYYAFIVGDNQYSSKKKRNSNGKDIPYNLYHLIIIPIVYYHKHVFNHKRSPKKKMLIIHQQNETHYKQE